MPITVKEKFGRRRTPKTRERAYEVRGTDDDDAALAAMIAYAPATLNGYPLLEDQCEVEESEGVVGGLFIGWARYGQEEGGSGTPAIGDDEYGFEIGAGSYTIYESKATVLGYTASGEASAQPNLNGLINVDADGTVNGVQVPPGTPQILTRSYGLNASLFTESYYRTLCGLVYHKNAGSFLGFDAGEVLFLGASGTKRGDVVSMQYRFGVELNWSGYSVHPLFSPVTKQGWDYWWVYYEDREDTTAKRLLPKPIAGFVERIFDAGNFGLLTP